MKVKLLSHVRLFATPSTAAYQAPPSMGFSRQEYWSGVPLPSPFFIAPSPDSCGLYFTSAWLLFHVDPQSCLLGQLSKCDPGLVLVLASLVNFERQDCANVCHMKTDQKGLCVGRIHTIIAYQVYSIRKSKSAIPKYLLLLLSRFSCV